MNGADSTEAPELTTKSAVILRAIQKINNNKSNFNTFQDTAYAATTSRVSKRIENEFGWADDASRSSVRYHRQRLAPHYIDIEESTEASNSNSPAKVMGLTDHGVEALESFIRRTRLLGDRTGSEESTENHDYIELRQENRELKKRLGQEQARINNLEDRLETLEAVLEQAGALDDPVRLAAAVEHSPRLLGVFERVFGMDVAGLAEIEDRDTRMARVQQWATEVDVGVGSDDS
jgi:hypothetical protein